MKQENKQTNNVRVKRKESSQKQEIAEMGEPISGQTNEWGGNGNVKKKKGRSAMTSQHEPLDCAEENRRGTKQF